MDLFEMRDADTSVYAPFVVKEVPQEMGEEADRLTENAERIDRKSNLPMGLGVVETVALIIAGITTVGILNSLPKVSLPEAFANAPVIFIGCLAAWLVWAVLFLLTKKKEKETTGSPEFAEIIRQIDDLEKKVWEEFEIPEDAKKIDVLTAAKFEKNGKMVHSKMFTHQNLDTIMYSAEGALYIVMYGSLIKIPLYELGTAKKEKNATFFDWHKEEAFDSKTYKPFKVRRNSGGIYFSNYYKIPISDISGDCTLLIPIYDMGPFMEMTGVRVEGMQ